VASGKQRKEVGGVRSRASRLAIREVGSVIIRFPCPDNCGGVFSHGKRIHIKGCPHAAVIYKADGATEKDWHCPYDCDPTPLEVGWCHHYTCPFWDQVGESETPF